LSSLVSNAQSRKAGHAYRGFTAGFGTRAFTLKSDILQISKARVVEAGGQLGVIFGNKVFRSSIGLLGIYSSVSNIVGTIDLYEAHASVNFYPLSQIRKKQSKIQPYLTGGLTYDKQKFRGHYMKKDMGTVNYSVSNEPYIGSLKQVNATIGTGLEVQLIDDSDFVHLFTEIIYGYNLSSTSKEPVMQNTSVQNQMRFAIGVRFGKIINNNPCRPVFR
jgi:hypothetical protein